eukprot:snap_masked-scaffold_3-processed-gene-13.9-mRNA-1 protein AED:1.00 eAED:1.00 QI:0/-1/0/0/-1/1/1/0/297
MKKSYKLKSNEVADTYIGIRLTKGAKNSCICNMSSHIVNGFYKHKLNLEQVQTAPTPINTDLTSDDTPKLSEEKEYQQMVGLANYIAINGRPDISFAVQTLATSMSCPTELGLTQVKRLFTYLKNTKEYSLVYRKLKEVNTLNMMVDSSHANGKEEKTVYGNIITLNNNVISYRSKLEPIYTRNSTIAEFIGISLSVKELKAIYETLKNLKIKVATRIFIDNQGALRMCKGESAQHAVKHISSKYKCASQEIKEMNAELIYVQTAENLADPFTKLVGKNKLFNLCEKVFQMKGKGVK